MGGDFLFAIFARLRGQCPFLSPSMYGRLIRTPNPIAFLRGDFFLAAMVFFGPADGIEEKFPALGAVIMRRESTNQVGRNFVDKLMIYVAPKIMGEGLQGIRGLSSGTLNDLISLKEMSIDKIGDDILIQGYPKT